MQRLRREKNWRRRSARALTLENEQMKISLSAEKTRAVTAEQETRSVLLAKSESEQVLTSIINELKETAKQQVLEIHRQKAEMDDRKNQVLNLEIQLGNLKNDKETTESALRATTEHLQQDLARTREDSMPHRQPWMKRTSRSNAWPYPITKFLVNAISLNPSARHYQRNCSL